MAVYGFMNIKMHSCCCRMRDSREFYAFGGFDMDFFHAA